MGRNAKTSTAPGIQGSVSTIEVTSSEELKLKTGRGYGQWRSCGLLLINSSVKNGKKAVLYLQEMTLHSVQWPLFSVLSEK